MEIEFSRDFPLRDTQAVYAWVAAQLRRRSGKKVQKGLDKEARRVVAAARAALKARPADWVWAEWTHRPLAGAYTVELYRTYRTGPGERPATMWSVTVRDRQSGQRLANWRWIDDGRHGRFPRRDGRQPAQKGLTKDYN